MDMTVTVLEELAEGAQGPLPKTGDKVVVHYSGWLAHKRDGKPFDCSREKGHAFTFTVGVGKVIPGWDDAIQTMGKGARRKLLISSDDAYGPKGRPPVIPANANLIFDIELLYINETLIEEGMRVRREEAERVNRFLRLQDEARAADALANAPPALPALPNSSKRSRRDDDASSSDGSSDDSSSSESSGERRKRKRERKERKRERNEKKKHKGGDKEKKKHKKHKKSSHKKSKREEGD